MIVISIGSDKKLFNPNSDVRKRQRLYAEGLEKFAIFVPVSNKNFSVQEDGNVTIFPVIMKNKFTGFFALKKAVSNFIKNLENKRDTVITSQDPFFLGLVSRLVSKKFGIPLEIQIHTDLFEYTKNKPLMKFLARYNLKYAQGVRYVSKFALKQLERLGLNIGDKSYAYPVFISQKEYSQAGFKKNAPIILVVSRFEIEKNVNIALEIFHNVRKIIPDAEMRIAGEGSLESDLRHKAVELGIESYVTFLGYVEDMPVEYQKAQILLHTSDFEGFGMVFVEAGQSGLPIVSTNTGVAPEITDYLFQGDDIDVAAAHIANILGDEGKWQKASINVLEKSKQFIFSEKEYYTKAREYWKKLCEKGAI